ncbi:MAG: VWA domain-containing protein [Clostridiales bacterium]|nr:VWA domain-containing protein [Clostridiales bacterium]MBR6987435.1 VWA domain-containing protein [Clostridiales bacterium]
MLENFSSSDFGSSTKRRLPICFALDTSGSMMGIPIKQLNMGLQNFVASIKSNDDTRSSTDIAIVTFGSKVDIVMPFGKISKDKGIPEIKASTTLTPIGEGVLTALELLNARKEGYKEMGIKYFQPWLVVITDGAPQGPNAVANMELAIKACNELEANDKLVVFNIGVGSGVDFDCLKRLSIKREEPISINSADFGKLFEFLGSSSSSIVSSGMNDDALYTMDTAPQGTAVDVDDFMKFINEDE